MIHTDSSPPAFIQRNQLWFRYLISLGVTALLAMWSTIGIVSPRWPILVMSLMVVVFRFINLSRGPDPANQWWHWGGLRWLQFLVELLLVIVCFGIFLLFLREIPFVRIRALVESPGQPWVLWALLALLQLRECLIIIGSIYSGASHCPERSFASVHRCGQCDAPVRKHMPE